MLDDNMSTATVPQSNTSYEMDPELKAYIYQHLMDLQPYLVNNAQIAVLVQRPTQLDKESLSAEHEPEYLVTLTATLDEGKMEAEGYDDDIYQAFIKAKDQMIHHLAEVQNLMMDPAEREVEVRAALSGALTLH